jgi:hypothetical protein
MCRPSLTVILENFTEIYSESVRREIKSVSSLDHGSNQEKILNPLCYAVAVQSGPG